MTRTFSPESYAIMADGYCCRIRSNGFAHGCLEMLDELFH